jgi:NADPH:quinone reductase-like Zn-dependent oxidoreductase
MKAAIVKELGKMPVYADFQAPVPSSGEERILVSAAAISPLVRGRAAGSHYSSTTQVPFVVGVDGAGRLADGRRVYFVLPKAPFGTMAEQAVVASENYIPLPEQLDDVTAAAIANPGMSSWAAFNERARLEAGETVLINGATGTAGRLAVQIARHLGAKKVIATGRNKEVLRELERLGADVVVPLVEDKAELENRFKEELSKGVDVVLDYLWGKSAEALLLAAAKTGKDGVPLRFVHAGASSGSDITLPGAVLRSSAIALMGSGIGSVSMKGLIHSIRELFHATPTAGFKIPTRSAPLSEVEDAWAVNDSQCRTVLLVR